MSLSEIQKKIAEKQLTCVGLVEMYLKNIRETAHLNAYIEVFEQEAMERAHQLDVKYTNNPETCGALFGCVVSIKDLICYEGHSVTGASKILENFKSVYSSTAVERLLNADAIIIGRTNCDQFGMGSDNSNSVYGVVKNPFDTTRVAGGSSGGSAVSIATNTCLVALGTDTGGSVRQPASFTNVIGLKPTYGRVSRHGLLAYASSFDQIGFFAHNAEDIAIVTSIVSGSDEFDATCIDRTDNILVQFKSNQTKTKKIAFLKQSFDAALLDSDVLKSMEHARTSFEKSGYTVEVVEFNLLDYIVPAYYVLTTAEASSNLSRYDGVRYGYRSTEAPNLETMYKKTRTEGFSEEVKRRILTGAFVLSAGYYDAYFSKAQRVRRLISENIEQIFKDFDLIVLPISPVVPWKIGEKSDDTVKMYMADIFTVLANMAGVPGISVPMGFGEETKLPIGVQILAKKWCEAELLQITEAMLKV